jgi:hypothetical protein
MIPRRKAGENRLMFMLGTVDCGRIGPSALYMIPQLEFERMGVKVNLFL